MSSEIYRSPLRQRASSEEPASEREAFARSPQAAEGERSSSGVDGRAKSRAGAGALQPDRPEGATLPRVRLLNVGYGNLVVASRIVTIVAPGASPMRRLRREASERAKLVDATEGRRTRSILIMDSDHVVLSAINPETLAARLGADEEGAVS
jgi:regulator of extracellular matrix RemA (YlzA/DUF370 family)